MQIFANGVVAGLMLAVLALAFNVAYLPTRTFHVALGGVYAGAPFIAWQIAQWQWPWPIAVAVAVVCGVSFSSGCEAFNHWHLERKGASSGAHLISSLGIYIVVIQAVAVIWGNETKTLRLGVDTLVTLGPVALTRAQTLAGAVSVLILVAFYAWLRFTDVGLQFRALADNPVQLALNGYNVRRLRLLAFGMSGFLASVSALLVAYDVGFDPHGGLIAVLLAIVAVIIGGHRTWLGPVLGGIGLGVLRSEVVWFYGAKWQDTVSFAVLALFLFLRPHGLMGSKTRLEAQP